MSQKINTTSLGLFIVAGLALAVIGLLLFSSSKFFTRTREAIVYFDTSLNGLNEGAPVKYRGVTIGSVKRVMVRFNQATNDFAMPVILELEEKLLRERMVEPADIFNDRALAERVKKGLRASLQSESLVTGVLYIDIRPNTNAPPPVFHQLAKRYPELPCEPTQMQQLFNNLASLDIKSIEKNVNVLLGELKTAVGSLRMAEISQGVTNVLRSVDRLVTSPEITNDLVAVRTTLDQYRALGEKLNTRINPVADSLTNSLAEFNRAVGQIRGVAENLRTLFAPDSPLRHDLDLALQQIATAGQSLTEFVDFLNRHPNALIAGREVTPKKP